MFLGERHQSGKGIQTLMATQTGVGPVVQDVEDELEVAKGLEDGIVGD